MQQLTGQGQDRPAKDVPTIKTCQGDAS